MPEKPDIGGAGGAPRRSAVRKLVTLPITLAEAVDRFRLGKASPRCVSCGQPYPHGKPASESDALRELVELGLEAFEQRRALAAAQSNGADNEQGTATAAPRTTAPGESF